MLPFWCVHVDEVELVAVSDQRLVLSHCLLYHVLVCFSHYRVLRRILHLIVCVGNPRRPLWVNLDKLVLSFEVYSVGGCVSLCDGDKPWVRAANASDCRRAFKSRY